MISSQIPLIHYTSGIPGNIPRTTPEVSAVIYPEFAAQITPGVLKQATFSDFT